MFETPEEFIKGSTNDEVVEPFIFRTKEVIPMHLKRYRRMIAIGFIALICWTTYLVIDSNHIEISVSAGDAAFSIAFDK